MGLDWNPANKPLPGHEAEYWRLFEELGDDNSPDRDSKQKRYQEISISAFETLDAPRIGVNPVADDWARKRYSDRHGENPPEEWLETMRGVYVVPLVERCDGVPHYSNGAVGGYVEPFSFRAQFLVECVYIIGEELLEQAYRHMRPEELRDFGLSLRHRAVSYANAHEIELDGIHEPEDPDCVEFHLDVVLAASRWCLFWASRGHPLESYW